MLARSPLPLDAQGRAIEDRSEECRKTMAALEPPMRPAESHCDLPADYKIDLRQEAHAPCHSEVLRNINALRQDDLIHTVQL